VKTPKDLYLEIARLIDPFDGDANTSAANPSFCAAIDHAYQAGWRDHEQMLIDQLRAVIKRDFAPPEVYP
jgi:hypothetical protein